MVRTLIIIIIIIINITSTNVTSILQTFTCDWCIVHYFCNLGQKSQSQHCDWHLKNVQKRNISVTSIVYSASGPAQPQISNAQFDY